MSFDGEVKSGYSYFYQTTLLLGLLLIWYFFKKRRWQNEKFPPGPTPLPLIGNVLQVGRLPHVTFMKWAKTYGPIMQLKMLSEKMVILSDPKLIKEIFNLPEAIGRMIDNPVIHELAKGPYGVVNAEGESWDSQRKFTIRTLRDFGFAKTSMEGLIMEDVNVTMNWLKQRENVSIPGNRIFHAPVSNTIWTIVNGQRNNWEHGESNFVKNAENTIKNFSVVVGKGVFYMPFLRIILPGWTGWSKFVVNMKAFHKEFEKCIEEHKNKLDDSESRDYIDHFLKEIDKTEDPKSSFYKDEGYKNLVGNAFDLFMAGSETTSTTLAWAMLYLSHHQEIQKKIHKEIDKVIGSSTPPTLSDRVKMPYVEAVILEALRIEPVIPLGGPHRVTKNFKFQGYSFEKDTVILANIYGVHRDPKIWGDPDTFRPERFLDEEEKNVVRHEALIPFAEGKRKCLGESMGRDGLFLYFTSVLQRFTILPGSKDDKPDFEPDVGSLLTPPKPFKVIFSPRVRIEE